jgi:hypothetical protein
MLAAAVVLLLTASADALQWPGVWNYGYGNVTVSSKGSAVAVKLNKDKGKKTGGYEKGAKLTVTLEAGSDANSPGGAWYVVQWSGLDKSKVKLSDRVGFFIGCEEGRERGAGRGGAAEAAWSRRRLHSVLLLVS